MPRSDPRQAVPLTTKRVLVAGVETSLGRTVATTVSHVVRTIAVVATANDPDEAFATQRLARKLRGPGQAIDGANDMAVRVMIRQISKEMGGLDAIVLCTSPEATALLTRYGGKELDRSGGGHLIVVGDHKAAVEPSAKRPSWILARVEPRDDDEETAAAVARVIAGDQLLSA